jgi:hypothetical protein
MKAHGNIDVTPHVNEGAEELMKNLQRVSRSRLVALAATLCVLLSGTTLAQEQKPGAAGGATAKKAHVLVLGVFHMNNPERDIFNLQVDDVLAPKRQKEIAETVAALKRFRPTKIAIEAEPSNEKVAKNYQDYLDGKYALTRNEREQLGYRLAKELGHKRLYPIDVEGDFPFDKVQEFAKKNGKEQALNAMMATGPKLIERESTILKNGTISDLLLFMNSKGQVRADQELYMDFAQFAGGGEYPGPDLLAEWFRRNVRIFANLRSVITSPEERVLVIYGAGHLYWLQRDVLDSRDLELDRFGDYAGRAEK